MGAQQVYARLYVSVRFRGARQARVVVSPSSNRKGVVHARLVPILDLGVVASECVQWAREHADQVFMDDMVKLLLPGAL